MRFSFVSFLCFSLFAIGGCEAPVGTAGGRCGENQSCNAGLICESAFCVEGSGDGGSAGLSPEVSPDGGEPDAETPDGGSTSDAGPNPLDTDNDGIPDATDPDDDNDGATDAEELACGSDPLVDASLPTDTDADGECDPVDTDDDADGVSDAAELACGTDPLNASSIPTDTDADGDCDVLDEDDDNDGVTDAAELACGSDPLVDTSLPTDTDADGECDPLDEDDDNDGVTDAAELACGSDPLVDTSLPTDTDADGECDPLDEDDDNDGATDVAELECGSDPLVDTSLPLDTDADGACDPLDEDDDNDGATDVDELACGSDPLVDTSLPLDTDADGACDPLDEDDDNDTFSDADELACGSDPIDATALPLDSDNDATCNAIDPCPLRADDNCMLQSDYADCFAIRLDGRLGPIPTGAYWIDSDGAAGNPPWQAWCDMDLDGGGWTLSIHQKATGNWADWDHNMDPSAVTGTYVADPLHDADFYRGFGDLIPDYDTADFLFASGDREHWLVTTAIALRLSNAGELAPYANVPVPVRRDSVGYERHTYNMYFRAAGTFDEDPWIGLGDHHDADFLALYGEGAESLYSDVVKNLHGGANVMVRRNGVNGWDNDGDGFPNQDEILCGTNALDINDVPNDEDGDFVCDEADHFLDDPTEGYDFDNDGIGDNADPDDDDDGDNDDVDPFPNNIVLTRDLSGLNMSGWDLRQFNLNFANLTDANLRDADMRSIALDEAILTGTDWAFARVHDLVPPCQDIGYRGGCALTSVTLGDVDLHGATLTNANFTGSNLWSTRFFPEDIVGSDWTSVAYAPFAEDFLGGPLLCRSGANWKGGCNAAGSVPPGADMRDANLVGATVIGATFDNILSAAGSDWSGAFVATIGYSLPSGEIVEENLVCPTSSYRGGCDLSGRTFALDTQLGFEPNFMGANLTGTTCPRCVTQSANFRDALFDNANFADAVLLQSDFSGARLNGATFQFSTLRFSVFDGATAIATNFDSADLAGLDMRGAIIDLSSFRFAEIMGADFSNSLANSTDWRDVFNAQSDGSAPVIYSGANLTNACMFTEVDIASIGLGVTPPPENLVNTIFNGVYGFFDQSKRCADGSVGVCAGNQTTWVCPLP